MGRGGGKKKGEFSVYDQNIIDETQWETMLSREVNLLKLIHSFTFITFINLISAILLCLSNEFIAYMKPCMKLNTTYFQERISSLNDTI